MWKVNDNERRTTTTDEVRLVKLTWAFGSCALKSHLQFWGEMKLNLVSALVTYI